MARGLDVFDATTCGPTYTTFPNLGPATPTFTEELRNRVLLYVLNSGNTIAPPCPQQAKYTFGGQTTQYPHVTEAPQPRPRRAPRSRSPLIRSVPPGSR